MKFRHTNVERRELPAMERAGSDARVIPGPEMYVVTFRETRVEWLTVEGGIVPVNRKLVEVYTGVPGTIAVVALSGESVVGLVDLLVYDGHNYQARSWAEREVALRELQRRIGSGLGGVIFGERIESAFIREFDKAVNRGYMGLIIRKPGDHNIYICSKGR